MCRFRLQSPWLTLTMLSYQPSVHWTSTLANRCDAVEQDSDHEAASFNAYEKMTPCMTSRAPDPYFSQWSRGHGCAPVNLRSMPATGSWNLWSILEFCHFQTIQQEMSKVCHIPYVVHVNWNYNFVYMFSTTPRSQCITSRRMALWFLCVSTQWSSPSNMTTTFH